MQPTVRQVAVTFELLEVTLYGVTACGLRLQHTDTAHPTLAVHGL
jgi:hypothetical protein